MKIKHVLATAGAALAMAGMTATTAHADYDLTGGDYTASSGTLTQAMQGGAYTMSCADVSLAGNTENVPGDSASTLLTPAIDGCTFFGFPIFVSATGPWKLTITDDVGGYSYGGALTLPVGSDVTFSIPIMGWSWTWTSGQTLGSVSLSAGQGSSGLFGHASGSGISYTSYGGPISSGTDGSIDLSNLEFPNVDIDES